VASARTLERDVHGLDAGCKPEPFRVEVRRAAGPAGTEEDLARARPRKLDEILERFHAQRRRHHERALGITDPGDAGEILERVVGKIAVQRRVDRESGGTDEERVAVGRGLRDEGRADRAARAGAVLDHHRLPPASRPFSAR
jgi:hypothetical protein